jgi:hypothetical protein
MHALSPIPLGHTNFLNKTGVIFFKIIYFVLPLFLIFFIIDFLPVFDYSFYSKY